MVETAEGTYVLTHRWWLDDMTLETDPIAWKQEALDASSQKGRRDRQSDYPWTWQSVSESTQGVTIRGRLLQGVHLSS